MASLFDEALAGIGAAITDVREKYEEAVWGRVVTDSGVGAPSEEPGAGFGSLTTTIEAGEGLGMVGPIEAGAPAEGLSGEVLPPLPEPGPGDTGGALRLESPVIDVEPDTFTAQLAAIIESPAIEAQSQSIDL